MQSYPHPAPRGPHQPRNGAEVCITTVDRALSVLVCPAVAVTGVVGDMVSGAERYDSIFDSSALILALTAASAELSAVVVVVVVVDGASSLVSMVEVDELSVVVVVVVDGASELVNIVEVDEAKTTLVV